MIPRDPGSVPCIHLLMPRKGSLSRKLERHGRLSFKGTLTADTKHSSHGIKELESKLEEKCNKLDVVDEQKTELNN